MMPESALAYRLAILFPILAFAGGLEARAAGALEARFTQPAAEVDAYDFVEVAIELAQPPAGNPFTQVSVEGKFSREDGGAEARVEGFCDSADGKIHRIRFLPREAGAYRYSVECRTGDLSAAHRGSFRVRDGKRKGLVVVDADHPWHFRWQGTGERYFWNGTTTYWLLGWDDETIRRSLDRLHRLKVNRVRVLLNGRVESGRDWYENVFSTDSFKFRLEPWPAARPDSLKDPGYDVTRFNVPLWQKYERLLRHARDRDIAVSVIFFVDGNKPGMDPFGKAGAGGEDEKRYYRYAAARFSAFSNVMWDLSNEYRFIRDEAWADRMGAQLKEWDPYDHLASIHGYDDFRFRASRWADFAMFQKWDEEGGHRFMLENRRLQAQTGRIIPQVNEEYGYEDHYPAKWGGGKTAPARSADNRRRLAWGIYMAGAYQTTGERADRGTGWGPDTGGGWVNGRGDDSMEMLQGYARIVDFFKAFEWWNAEPHDDLVEQPAWCLAEPGRVYALYLPPDAGGGPPVAGGPRVAGSTERRTTVKLEPGRYRARWYNPRIGGWQAIGSAQGPRWASPPAPDGGDWALLLVREESAGASGAAAPERPAAASPNQAAGDRPLSLHPQNPHYLLFRGKPVVLVTSAEHYGAVLNLDFNYVPYLDELKARGFNLTRTFSGAYREIPGSFNIRGNTLAPLPQRFACPWARSDTPGYFDGGNKFDLSRWDPAYFERLKDFLRKAGERGIIVELVLFCPMYEEALWKACPMNVLNNVNGVGKAPANEVYTLQHADLLETQLALVRKLVSELQGFDNLYYEICNEPYFGGVQLEWQHRIADTIVEAESAFSARHLIAQNIANAWARVANPHPAVSIFNFHYASPPRAVAENYHLGKPIGFDESGFRGSNDAPYRTEAWDFLLAGGAVYNNLDYSFTADREDGTAEVSAPGGGGVPLRRQLQTLKTFLEGFDFLRMRPDPELVKGGLPAGLTARVLSEPGRAYAVYLHGRSSGPFSARWSGKLEPRFSETYALHTFSNDGVRLWLDGKKLIDDWTDHAGKEDRAEAALQAGRKHDLVMEFYQNGGSAAAKLSWSSPSQKKELIPPSSFSTDGGSPGLKAEYFEDKDLKLKKLERTDAKIDFEWSEVGPFQAPDEERELRLELELPPGSWRAEWIAPISGEVAGREELDHAGGTRAFPSPRFREDVALRILRK